MSDDGTVSVRVGDENYAILLDVKHWLERKNSRTASLDDAIGQLVSQWKGKKRAKKSKEEN